MTLHFGRSFTLFTGSFHLFLLQILIEHLPYTRYCARCSTYRKEENMRQVLFLFYKLKNNLEIDFHFNSLRYFTMPSFTQYTKV